MATLNKKSFILLVLTLAEGKPLSPIQLQKGIFLIQERLPDKVLQIDRYQFESYKWGPYSQAVFNVAEQLTEEGLVAIIPAAKPVNRTYSATQTGIAIGRGIVKASSPEAIQAVSYSVQEVLSLSFDELLNMVYEEAPDYTEESLYAGPLKPGEYVARNPLEYTSTTQRAREIPYSEALAALRWVLAVTNMGNDRLARLLDASPELLSSWLQGLEVPANYVGRIMATRDVLKIANRRYQTPRTLSSWLNTPDGSSGQTPENIMQAGDYDNARFLAMVSPSAGVEPIQSILNEAVPEESKERVKRGKEAFASEEDLRVRDVFGKSPFE